MRQRQRRFRRQRYEFKLILPKLIFPCNPPANTTELSATKALFSPLIIPPTSFFDSDNSFFPQAKRREISEDLEARQSGHYFQYSQNI